MHCKWSHADSDSLQPLACTLMPRDQSGVSGTVIMQPGNGVAKVTWDIKGLQEGDRGFHVHTWGDIPSEYLRAFSEIAESLKLNPCCCPLGFGSADGSNGHFYPACGCRDQGADEVRPGTLGYPS